MTAYSKALVAFGAIAQTAAFTAVVPKASITQRSFFLPSYPRPSINPPASSLFAAGDDESLPALVPAETPEQKRFVKATLELSKAKQKVSGLKKAVEDATDTVRAKDLDAVGAAEKAAVAEISSAAADAEVITAATALTAATTATSAAAVIEAVAVTTDAVATAALTAASAEVVTATAILAAAAASNWIPFWDFGPSEAATAAAAAVETEAIAAETAAATVEAAASSALAAATADTVAATAAETVAAATSAEAIQAAGVAASDVVKANLELVAATAAAATAKETSSQLVQQLRDAKEEQSNAQKEYDEARKDVPITRTNIEWDEDNVHVKHMASSDSEPAGKPNAGKQNCLIVIRHGRDVDDNKRKNGERTKTLPNGEKVVYYQDGLNEDGKKQAKSIAKVLPKFVDDLDISAITRVITKDPRTTPNPFDTILPFIEAQNIMDVRLPSTLDGIKNSQLFPDDTSVLVCFDQEVLWSPKVNGKRAPKPSSESLLHYVNKAYEIDTDIPGPPEKGRTIYIYRGKGKMEVHELDHLHDIVFEMH